MNFIVKRSIEEVSEASEECLYCASHSIRLEINYAVASPKWCYAKRDCDDDEFWIKESALRPWPCKIHKHQIDYHSFQCDGQGEQDLIYGHSSAGHVRCNLPFSSVNCFSVYHPQMRFREIGSTFHNKVNRFHDACASIALQLAPKWVVWIGFCRTRSNMTSRHIIGWFNSSTLPHTSIKLN